MHIRELAVDNSTDHTLEVFLELWGVSVTLPARTTFRLVGTGEYPGELEIERGANAITVYAWPSSTIAVYEGKRLVEETLVAIPHIPEGMNVREFLGMVFSKRV